MELNRWGDYFGIYLDPANNFDVWMISEYAAAINIWSTYVGQIRMEPYSGAHVFLKPVSLDFGDVEIGTKILTCQSLLLITAMQI
ncbi:MAG: hypothetical protein MZV64_32715 [Ignavibacteriales bacterium]|nr:hypothetical protein [Ignavibacteriales bacterium]